MESKNDNNKITSKKENIEDVMRDLEKKINSKIIDECLHPSKNTINQNVLDNLVISMEAGSKEFEERVGRPMTYGEMRAMWG